VLHADADAEMEGEPPPSVYLGRPLSSAGIGSTRQTRGARWDLRLPGAILLMLPQRPVGASAPAASRSSACGEARPAGSRVRAPMWPRQRGGTMRTVARSARSSAGRAPPNR
jgi:hypothetical protein